MIVGVVNATREATIRLAVHGANQQTHQIDATVDTGFTGSLTLPLALITTLELPWFGRAHGMLGDGSLHVFDVYAANVLWDGQDRLVETDAADTVPLVGMGPA